MRRAARARAGSAVALALAVLAAGCGGDDGPRSTTPVSKIVGETADADAAIVRLVEVRGALLNLGAARLFGDRARLADAGFVRTVAAERAAAAERLRGQAVRDSGTLARLAGSASISTASAGEALVGFERCARLGIDVLRHRGFRSRAATRCARPIAPAARRGAPTGPRARSSGARRADIRGGRAGLEELRLDELVARLQAGGA